MREMVNKNREEGNLVFEWVDSTNGRKICVIPAQSGKICVKNLPQNFPRKTLDDSRMEN